MTPAPYIQEEAAAPERQFVDTSGFKAESLEVTGKTLWGGG